MWYNQRFIALASSLLLVLLIIYLLIQLHPIFDMIFLFISSILFPIMMAGVLYYLLRPIRDFLEKRKCPHLVAITLLFLILLAALSLVVGFIWPYVSIQIAAFNTEPQTKLIEVENRTIELLNVFNFSSYTHDQLRDSLRVYLQWLANLFFKNLFFTLSSIATFASYIIVTPFILFYLLKDDDKIAKAFDQKLPHIKRAHTQKILKDVDKTLSSYISGQVTVAFFVGLLIWIGYTIIGLRYAALLAFIAFIFNLIPFCGPVISTIPALIIGFEEGAFTVFEVLVVISAVHLLDLNLISPRVVGNRLQIHPVTIILLLIAGASTMGFVGLFLIVPLYAVLKTLLSEIHLFKNNETDLTYNIEFN